MEDKTELAGKVIVVTFAALLHLAWAWDLAVYLGIISQPMITTKVREMLADKPGVCLLLGYLICHLVRG